MLSQRGLELTACNASCTCSYPDANLPTVLVYHEGQCKQTLGGWQQYGGERMTPEQASGRR